MADEQDAPREPDDEALEVDEAALQDYLATAQSEQSLFSGIIGGCVGAAIGATAWALITISTNTEFALAAIGVGFLAGYGVRIGGKGFETKFGVVGAILAALGCAVGKLLAIAIILSRAEEASFVQVLLALLTQPDTAVQLLAATFHLFDLLIYGIAIYEGYRFAFRRLSQEELDQFVKPAQSQAPSREQSEGDTAGL